MATTAIPAHVAALAARLDPAIIRAELARRSLLGFTTYTFPGYHVNWHHAVVASALDRWVRGAIKRLAIFLPPRHGKSELVSRRLPAWIFGQRPDARIIATSYGFELAERMNRDVQRIMDSPRYKTLYPDTILPDPAARAIMRAAQRNSSTFDIITRDENGRLMLSGGNYRAAGIGGPVTGLGADFIIIDDPVKNREDANSDTIRETVWEWYTSTLYTRLEKDARLLLTMTRWHHDDLAGRLLKRMQDETGEQFEVLTLPAVLDAAPDPCDPRATGEALWPEKYATDTLDTIRLAVGSFEWESLFQQRPTPAAGLIFKPEWLRTHRLISVPTTVGEHRAVALDTGQTFPLEHCKRFIVVDLAVSLKDSADYTVMLVCLVTPAHQLVLVDMLRERLDAPAQIRKLDALVRQWAVQVVWAESVQYQLAFVQMGRAAGLPVREMQVDRDKLSRAIPAATLCEQGRVFVPEVAPWRAAFQSELAEFPQGKHDDQVDCLSGACRVLPQLGALGQMPITMAGASYWTSLGRQM